jgi:SpoVK/Ycf46/Vps4 family AAA+-type ATPase
MNSSWLEQCEVSRSLLPYLAVGEDVTEPTKKALHIFLPNCSVGSFVAEPVGSSLDLPEDVLIHPIMYEFLSHAWKTWINGWGDNDDFPEKRITIGPLAMEPNHCKDMIDSGGRQPATWHLCTLPIHDLKRPYIANFKIVVSCLFLDPKLEEYRLSVDDNQFTLMVQGHFLGRLVKVDSVVVFSTKHGFGILEVKSVTAHGVDSSIDMTIERDQAYRIPLSSDSWRLEVDFPEHNDPPITLLDMRATWESTIPGYETLRDQLFNLSSLRQSPSAPTGVLLTGVSGVGKTRLASSLADTFTTSYDRADNVVVFYLSVRDLIFHASTESDIFEGILAPRLMSTSLWIVDDLQLLEREDSNDAMSQSDMEYIVICGALLQAIDQFKRSCFIVGIGHDAARLPHSLTKNGRLEKHVEMLSPTQQQRFIIWNDILLKDVPTKDTRQAWSWTLVASTPGCIAADLHRIYRDAWTRCWARKPQEEQNPTFEWNDLREAARICVPSHLAELDVARPRVFSSELPWIEIHHQSWQCLVGYENLKRDVFRQVVVPWKQFLALSDDPAPLVQSWIKPPAGVLFHGHSGCGKTEAAKCLASSLELSIIQVRASDILDKWLGGSEALLRSLFARARASAPCILFLDEIDAIACNRAEEDSNDSSSRILSTLLNEMDGVSSGLSKCQILVVACTNRLSDLDAALLRPGRLQEHFEVLPPAVDDLSAILMHFLKNVPLRGDVSIPAIATALAEKKTTGADVEGLCRELCLSALRSTGSLQDFSISERQIADICQLNI